MSAAPSIPYASALHRYADRAQTRRPCQSADSTIDQNGAPNRRDDRVRGSGDTGTSRAIAQGQASRDAWPFSLQLLHLDVGERLVRRRRKPEHAGSNPAVQTRMMEGQANWRWHPARTGARPNTPLRVRLPLLPLHLSARGRAAEASVFQTEKAGSTPAGHSSDFGLARSTSGEVAGLSSRPEGIVTPTGCSITLVVKRTSWLPPKEQVQVRFLAGVSFLAVAFLWNFQRNRRWKMFHLRSAPNYREVGALLPMLCLRRPRPDWGALDFPVWRRPKSIHQMRTEPFPTGKRINGTRDIRHFRPQSCIAQRPSPRALPPPDCSSPSRSTDSDSPTNQPARSP